MIVTRAPYRISLMGGSTDFPNYYTKFGAVVIGLSINLYVYTCVLQAKDGLFPYKSRITYSVLEDVQNYCEIINNGVRGPIGYFNITDGLHISIQTSLPSQSGIASSSALILALSKALDVYKHQQETIQKIDLAKIAIWLSKETLSEEGGCQDEILCASGGQNIITLKNNGFRVRKWGASYEFLEEFNKRLAFVYLGSNRKSYQLAENHKNADIELKHQIQKYTQQCVKAIQDDDIDLVGYLLNETWNLKKQIAGVSNDTIEEVYANALLHGAIGGKLLGSGGTGFMIFLLKDGVTKEDFATKIGLHNIDWDYDNDGVKLLVNK